MPSHNSSSWITHLARAGYAAKGIVYGTVGIMAILAAAGTGVAATGSSGALREIASKPFGAIALIIIGVGLLAYSVYRFMCSIFDSESKGDDGGGLAKRAGYLGSAIFYAALGVSALTGLGGSGDKEKEMTSGVLSMPGGKYLLGTLAIAIIIAGIFQWIKALKGSYKTKFTLDSFASGKRHWIERSAKFGLIARGIVFPIMGGFLLIAAIQSDASEAVGLGQALEKLQNQSYGSILLGVTAAGLICYAIYCEILAVYGNFENSH
ncbi:membrane protein [Oceaniferula spumae]|uniref:Membrane protein n=1 Tax=Oceaniferula spumae TaxID=2979115 RepID=A0AAT9FK83_9BACT